MGGTQESDDLSQTTVCLEIWIISLWLGFRVFGFWAKDKWGE